MGESRGDRQPHDVIEHSSDRVGSDWAYLSDLAEVNPRSPSPTDGETVSFVAMADVSESGVIDNVERRKTSTGYTPFAVGDVLVAKITPCFENGKGAHVRGLPTRCGLGSTEFHVLRPRSTTSDRYLYHLTRTSQFRLRGEGLMSGSAGQRRVPTEFFSRYAVRMPPLEEQRRIAEILDTIDETIQATDRVIAKLRVAVNGLISDAVENALRAGETRSLGEIADGIPGSLIQTGPFGSQLHASEYVTEGIPAFMPTDISDGTLDVAGAAKISAKKADELGRHRLRVGDVLFARRGDLSRCAVVAAEQDGGLCGTGCLLVRIPETGLSPVWLATAYRHDAVQRQVLARAVGSTMLNLSAGLVRSLLIPCPTRVSKRLMKVAQESARRIEGERVNLAKLGVLRAGLAADLLSGRVRTVPA